MTRYVCSSCFGDPAIKEYIEENSVGSECSFCEEVHERNISIPIDNLIRYMRICVSREYDNAAEWLPYESSEGGYQGETIDAWDLIVHELEIELPEDKDGELLQCLSDGFSDHEWCKEDPYGPSSMELAKYSWENFSYIVKNRRRFFFRSEKSEDSSTDVLSPGELLEKVLDYANHVNLVTRLGEGLVLYRARAHSKDGKSWSNAKDLGPPPPEKALQSNRMSPAGIPMFYGSDSSDTAVFETAIKSGKFSVGRFCTARPIKLLDLSNLPTLPSIFDMSLEDAEISPRSSIPFLRHVSEQISKPITKDSNSHIEYVPTQVVTEFIRSQSKIPIDGIKYESAIHSGYCSYVLFAGQEDVFENAGFHSAESWLELKEVTNVEAKISLKKIPPVSFS